MSGANTHASSYAQSDSHKAQQPKGGNNRLSSLDANANVYVSNTLVPCSPPNLRSLSSHNSRTESPTILQSHNARHLSSSAPFPYPVCNKSAKALSMPPLIHII